MRGLWRFWLRRRRLEQATDQYSPALCSRLGGRGMARATYQGPPDRLEAYENVVARFENSPSHTKPGFRCSLDRVGTPEPKPTRR